MDERSHLTGRSSDSTTHFCGSQCRKSFADVNASVILSGRRGTGVAIQGELAGIPSTRSLTALRAISDAPPPMLAVCRIRYSIPYPEP